ncbi:OmpH family outer membrane protein [Planctomicrobium sp. SH668]|uniref:OmpH family outer membrane protein n=1 Tax=Planctomicrobium sp. SH668 TaxID=3448126 RepID=UPI003F5B8BA7
MNRISCLLLGICTLFTGQLLAQAPSAAEPTPARVGLIDMAYLFKNSEKFVALTQALEKEIEATDEQAKTLADQVRNIQAQLASNVLQPGSPEAEQLEADLFRSNAELETFKQQAQQGFIRKEAEIYKTIYLESENAVKMYSKHYGYTLVIRFDQNEVEQAQNPQQVINAMNRQVVHFRPTDDMTKPILNYLNGEWKKELAGQSVSQKTDRSPAGTN